MIILFFI